MLRPIGLALRALLGQGGESRAPTKKGNFSRALGPRIRTIFGMRRFLTMLGFVALVQTASLTGTVNDPAGAILPGVSITITQLETNAARMFVTDEHGDYRVPLLPPGRYRVE